MTLLTPRRKLLLPRRRLLFPLIRLPLLNLVRGEGGGLLRKPGSDALAATADCCCDVMQCCEGVELPATVYMDIAHSGSGPCSVAACAVAASMTNFPMDTGGGLSYVDSVGDSIEDFCNAWGWALGCNIDVEGIGQLSISASTGGGGVSMDAAGLSNPGSTGTFAILSCDPLHIAGTIIIPATPNPGDPFVGLVCQYNMDGSTDAETFTIDITE